MVVIRMGPEVPQGSSDAEARLLFGNPSAGGSDAESRQAETGCGMYLPAPSPGAPFIPARSWTIPVCGTCLLHEVKEAAVSDIFEKKRVVVGKGFRGRRVSGFRAGERCCKNGRCA